MSQVYHVTFAYSTPISSRYGNFEADPFTVAPDSPPSEDLISF